MSRSKIEMKMEGRVMVKRNLTRRNRNTKKSEKVNKAKFQRVRKAKMVSEKRTVTWTSWTRMMRRIKSKKNKSGRRLRNKERRMSKIDMTQKKKI